ncbi:MAG TPA: hypothetical protein VLY21_01840 [Nitrososphaerales archaeon]|nr:hypothetical protein [Nitrososphaerales archaeon]
MTAGADDIRRLFESAETDFLLSRTRVTMNAPLEDIEAGDVKLGMLKQGETVELPRWVAEELAKLKLAEVTEEPFETELFKALGREKMLGPFQLSGLAPEFYMMMRRRLAYLRSAVDDGRVKKDDFEKIRASSYDLLGVRLGKLLSMSSASTSLSTIAEKLTPEERAFFTLAQSFSKEWKNALLRDEV